MNYEEAIQYLYHLRTFGMKLGLEKVRRLMDRAGSPDKRLNFIHVAGTNGKGSVCAFLNQGLRSMGFRVGMFTSPHLIHFGERIQVDGENISQQDTIRWTHYIREIIEEPGWTDEPPTFFEAITVMAALRFQEAGCDWVVWETGLGGRLDSTNIVSPQITLLTHIDMDHQDVLGNSIEKIASEKAGIIKPGIPVFMANTQPAATAVAQRRAKDLGCFFEVVDPAQFKESLKSSNNNMLLQGSHQLHNAALAWQAIQHLQNSSLKPNEQLQPQQIAAELASTEWPGRCQLVQGKEKRIFILDGAHNPSGVKVLIETIRKAFTISVPISLWFSAFKDKDGLSMLMQLVNGIPGLFEICLIQGAGERAANIESWIHWLKANELQIPVRIFTSVQEGSTQWRPSVCYIITGSLHFIGEALELIQANEQTSSTTRKQTCMESERGLNFYNHNNL